jgi:hypothetical protein
MNVHDSPGVVPGRYAGEPISIHDGPTSQQVDDEQHRAHADGLAGRICAAAADAARCQCRLLELLGEFDAVRAIRYWTDFKSLAHWLSWACSMTPGVAREHVRVAKALRQMPTIVGLFRGCALGSKPSAGWCGMSGRTA